MTPVIQSYQIAAIIMLMSRGGNNFGSIYYVIIRTFSGGTELKVFNQEGLRLEKMAKLLVHPCYSHISHASTDITTDQDNASPEDIDENLYRHMAGTLGLHFQTK